MILRVVEEIFHSQPGNAKKILNNAPKDSNGNPLVYKNKDGNFCSIEAGRRIFGFLKGRVTTDINEDQTDYISKITVCKIAHDESDPYYFDGNNIAKRSELPAIQKKFDPFEVLSVEEFVNSIL